MNINISLKTILGALNNVISCDADGDLVIDSIRSLPSAGPQDLAIILPRGDASVFDPISLATIAQSKAGIFLTQHPVASGNKCILVSDALAAYTQLIGFVDRSQNEANFPPAIEHGVTIHTLAVIGSGAHVGAGAVIGAHVFIGRNAHIGKNVLLHPGAKVLDRCIIGDDSIIQSGAVIGSDGYGYQATKKGMLKIPQIGIVRMGKNVEIGANCMIDRASFDETIIGDGVKIDNGVHVAHNVKIGPHTAILAQSGIAGSVEIGAGCQIGGQVAIRDNVKIGNGAKIVSKSGVLKNVKAGEIVAGIPAMPLSQWKRISASIHKLPELINVMRKTLRS